MKHQTSSGRASRRSTLSSGIRLGSLPFARADLNSPTVTLRSHRKYGTASASSNPARTSSVGVDGVHDRRNPRLRLEVQRRRRVPCSRQPPSSARRTGLCRHGSPGISLPIRYPLPPRLVVKERLEHRRLPPGIPPPACRTGFTAAQLSCPRPLHHAPAGGRVAPFSPLPQHTTVSSLRTAHA